MQYAITPTTEPTCESSIEALEAELTTLAGHLNAANYRFLHLLGELDARDVHQGWWHRVQRALAELAMRRGPGGSARQGAGCASAADAAEDQRGHAPGRAELLQGLPCGIRQACPSIAGLTSSK
jgi:hypothetical protein